MNISTLLNRVESLKEQLPSEIKTLSSINKDKNYQHQFRKEKTVSFQALTVVHVCLN